MSLKCPVAGWPAREVSRILASVLTYPIQQLFWSQDFAIFIQPARTRVLSLAVVLDTGRYHRYYVCTCMSYRAPGGNTQNQSLSRPPGLLPVVNKTQYEGEGSDSEQMPPPC